MLLVTIGGLSSINCEQIFSDHFSIIESFTPLENHNPEVIDASEQEPYSNSDEDEGLPF